MQGRRPSPALSFLFSGSSSLNFSDIPLFTLIPQILSFLLSLLERDWDTDDEELILPDSLIEMAIGTSDIQVIGDGTFSFYQLNNIYLLFDPLEWCVTHIWLEAHGVAYLLANHGLDGLLLATVTSPPISQEFAGRLITDQHFRVADEDSCRRFP